MSSRAIHVRVEDFPYCCGINIVGQFDNDPDVGGTLKEAVNDHGTILSTGFGDDVEGCALMATTTPDQKLAIKQLRKYGFTKVATFKNPSTKNFVSVWFRQPSA